MSKLIIRIALAYCLQELMRDTSRVRVSLLAVVVLVIAGTSRFSLALTAEAAVVPQSTDNFYEARACLWLSNETDQPDGILVLLKGTDSDARNLAESEEWQRIASQRNLGILGCHFRGDGEPYEQAEGGSGAALLAMIDQLAEYLEKPQLARIPLYIVGHSSGAMFAYNFTCWRPYRVGSFVLVKSGPISPKGNAEAMRVPGLFIVGLNDLAGRISSTIESFAAACPDHHWTLAIEEDGGHGWTQSTWELLAAYLEAIVQRQPARAEGRGEYLKLPASPFKNRGTVIQNDKIWLPNAAFTGVWKDFSGALSIAELLVAGRNDKQRGDQRSAVEIDLGEIELNANSLVTGTAQIRTDSLPTDQSILFEPDNSAISVIATRQHSGGVDIDWRFEPRGLVAGWFRSQLIVGGGTQSEKLVIPIRAKLVGSVSAAPASAYVGVVPRGKTVSQRIMLTGSEADFAGGIAVESSRPNFASATICDKQQAGAVALDLTFDGSKGLGNQSGIFTVRSKKYRRAILKFTFIAWVSK